MAISFKINARRNFFGLGSNGKSIFGQGKKEVGPLCHNYFEWNLVQPIYRARETVKSVWNAGVDSVEQLMPEAAEYAFSSVDLIEEHSWRE